MKKVPFVSNSSDNMHCINAVFRMVHQYYLGSDLTWKEIDGLTMAEKGKATWTFMGEMAFAKKGISVTNIEPLDYLELYKKGTGYFSGIFGADTANYYIHKSNISSVIKYIPEYLKAVKHETRKATLEEIRQLLKSGALVEAELNSRILNHREGFSLHAVLIYSADASGFFLHDPGLPPIRSRHVSFAEFDKAFNFEGSNGGIIVFRELEGGAMPSFRSK